MNKLARHAWQLVQQTWSACWRDNVLKLSASLSYFTLFSLGPMLLVVLFVSGMFWRSQALAGHLFRQVQELLGATAARQLQELLRRAALDGSRPLQAGIGLVALLVAATSAFTEIQDSLNGIWQLKTRPGAGWFQLLRTRLLSFSLVVGLGFLLLVSLGLNAAVAGLREQLEAAVPHLKVGLVYGSDLALTLLLATGLFAVVFKVLPDARIRWKDVGVGAAVTAGLFMLGRFGIAYYIRHSNLNSTYGTAGALVVLLVWVYYSALVLYVGAEFTKCYAVAYGAEIHADQYAMVVQTVRVESKHGNVQRNEQNRERTERELQKAKDALDADLAPQSPDAPVNP